MMHPDLVEKKTEKGTKRVAVQKFGTFLSNMVMPNIAAFIAWGLITALFIQSGWLNAGGNGSLAPDSWVARLGGWGDFEGGGIVGPMITYLLPLLIGYTGGRMVYDTRGGVVGAIATIGVITGSDIPMFMGAMLLGPLGGWSMKKLDGLWDDKIRPGFEMLVNNFSAGIWGGILAVLSFFFIGPFVAALSNALGAGVGWLVDHGLLPLTSILIEPAKVLFLNNAINHGVLTPLGTTEAVETGKSILFLLEANPGPGLGLLLAFSIAGTGLARASAPGAALIQFVGGIHEIYFPYVLAKPRLILALILGGMTGVFTNVIFGSGLRAPAAPGSIIAVLLQTPVGSYVGVILSVVLSATVTFIVSFLLLKTDRSKEVDLEASTRQMVEMKGGQSVATGALRARGSGPIRTIAFACDAGMGSSAMGASMLRKQIRVAGFGDVTVVNKAISSLSDDFDVVVTHEDLARRAEEKTPSAVHFSVDNFLQSPRYEEIVELVAQSENGPASEREIAEAEAPGEPVAEAMAEHAATDPDNLAGVSPVLVREEVVREGPEILPEQSIVLHGTAKTREQAVEEAGVLLLATGAVTADYVASMHERERSVSTAMGSGLAIPHGTDDLRDGVNHTSISFVRYDEPIDWGGKPVEFVIGIAGTGDDHLPLLQQVAKVFLNEEQIGQLRTASSPEEIKNILGA